MLESLKAVDTQWFLWVNNHHNTMMDWLMWSLSQHWFWTVVLVLAFGFLTLRHEPRHWWVVVVGVALCFLLADQGSVHLLKDTVCRLRPCHALEGVRMFRTHCGGQYGFVSSHAANAFGVTTFLLLRYRGHRLGGILLTLWALATCYSRIYLGKHYPGDIVGGALFGIIIGLIVWWLIKFVEKKMYQRETK